MLSSAVLLLAMAASAIAATNSSVCTQSPYAQFSVLSPLVPVQSFCSSNYPCTATATTSSTSTVTVTAATVTVTTGTTVIPTTVATASAQTTIGTITSTVNVINTVGTVSVCPPATRITTRITTEPPKARRQVTFGQEKAALLAVRATSVNTTSTTPTSSPTQVCGPLGLIVSSLLARNKSVISTACSCIETCTTTTTTRLNFTTTTATPSVLVNATSYMPITATATATVPVNATTTTTSTAFATFTVTVDPSVCAFPTCTNPQVGCTGFQSCGAGGNCACYSTDSGPVSACLTSDQDCGPACTTSADCTYEQVCITNTCCGDGSCLLRSTQCESTTAPSRIFRLGRKDRGSQIRGPSLPWGETGT
jgi:hypothetical protein